MKIEFRELNYSEQRDYSQGPDESLLIANPGPYACIIIGGEDGVNIDLWVDGEDIGFWFAANPMNAESLNRYLVNVDWHSLDAIKAELTRLRFQDVS